MIDHCPHTHPLDNDDATMAHAPEAGRKFWRSLEELSGMAEFEQYLHREFPQAASVWTDAVSRRKFLALMGASVALAGMSGCYRKPTERIVPYVVQPEQLVQGNALHYATAMPFAGFAKGVRVEQQMGRPTKVEGNPNHPSTLGGTDVFMQAAPLELCDPDRSQVPLQMGNITTWGAFDNNIREVIAKAGGPDRVRIRILTETVTSPTLAGQIAKLSETYKKLRWHQYQPFGRNNSRLGAYAAFGRHVNTIYDFSKARRVLSLDANFLMEDAGSLRYANEFIANRRVKWKDPDLRTHHVLARAQKPGRIENAVPDAQEMTRLYVIESGYTITGAKADHRLAVKPSDVEILARAIGGEIAGATAPLPPHLQRHQSWVTAVAQDLKANAGASLIIAGESQPPEVHTLVHAINAELKNIGATVTYIEPVEANPEDELQSLRELTDAMQNREVDLLLMLGGNPVFDSPADFNFRVALQSIPWRAHLGLYLDETSYHCHWHLPESHFLESWGDIRGHDGTVSIIQPLIAPLYSSRSASEVLASLAGSGEAAGYAAVTNHWFSAWRKENSSANVEQMWIDALRAGVIENTQSPKINVQSAANLQQILQRSSATQPAQVEHAIELSFRPDPTIFDGRFANVGWLQECPKPITKLTWDNAAYISPETAVALALSSRDHPEQANGQMLQLKLGDRSVALPAWVVPGHPDQVVTVHCGYGRERIGRVGEGAGFNVYPLRTSSGMHAAPGLSVSKLETRHPLACTQNHQLMHGRELVRLKGIEELQKEIKNGPPVDINLQLDGDKWTRGRRVPLSIYPEYPYNGYRWGMVIDQTACIGCNACVVACQSENNIPVVGKEEVLRGREMHWLRIDTYFTGPGPDEGQGEDDNTILASMPDAVFQPMLCQHCEKAPCELVCPVEATSHSSEGINEMTYNRCVGTRYCSNNCPYKVRRFNFFQYNDGSQPSLEIMRNPEVTVRTRGVMEKCTYCIQRINRARTDGKVNQVRAEQEGGAITFRTVPADLQPEIELLPATTQQTACQQACPTEAIIFGDMNDADSYVHRLKYDPRYQYIHYGLLTELNTQPRTTYLERLSNPNPAISAQIGSRSDKETAHHS